MCGEGRRLVTLCSMSFGGCSSCVCLRAKGFVCQYLKTLLKMNLLNISQVLLADIHVRGFSFLFINIFYLYLLIILKALGLKLMLHCALYVQFLIAFSVFNFQLKFIHSKYKYTPRTIHKSCNL